MRAVKPRSWWGAVVLAATGACFPQGPPPSGQQLLTGREASLAGLVPPNGDGLLRILLLRPGATSDLGDLSVVSLDQANHPSPELPLISDILLEPGVGCGATWPAPCGVRSSATVQVHRADGSFAAVNAITGEVDAQTPQDAWPLYKTPGGRSFRIDDSGTGGTLTDGDGRTTQIALYPPNNFHQDTYQFVGEEFVYQDPQENLIDLPPSDVPQQLATGVLQFSGWTTPAGPLLILTRLTSSAVLDMSSGTETTLPFKGSTAVPSADGRWVLDNEAASAGMFTFFDFRAGVQQTAQIYAPAINQVWRPGTSELWVTSFAGSNDSLTTWVVRPDAPVVTVPGAYLASVNGGGIAVQPFTDDGRYWFFTTTLLDSPAQVIQVGQAIDPTGPAFPLNPPSTVLSLALPLRDGRILTTSYAKDQNRSDVTAVDPLTGQTDVLARRGLLVTSGTTRVMGLFHVVQTAGDLTTIDLTTERTSVLAPEFAVSAAAEAQGADALAPGTRIVYQFKARSVSPYDGIWLTTCP